MKDLICIIPICSFKDAKSRLSVMLSDTERVELLKSMLKDIITAVRSQVMEIILVSRDEEVYSFAKELSVSFVNEKDYEDKSSTSDMVISPSRGGGTNLICFSGDFDFEPLFGDMSYFRHLEEAYMKNMDVNVIESFYLSLDVNTSQDLGEIFLHGIGTNTHEYLSGLNISVNSSHGQERLDVKRNDE